MTHKSFTDRGHDLLISISGIRGTIPGGLDPDNIVAFAKAFASVTKGKRVVVGYDARPTGPALQNLFQGTLMAAGKQVLDAGLCPTPTVKAAVREFRAAGGVMISASHNPLQWNGFKLIKSDGLFFDAAASRSFLRALERGDYKAVDHKAIGQVRSIDAIQSHIESVLEVLPNVAAIRKMKYQVVVDGVAGAGREALPALLEELGCKVIRLFCEATPGGRFPRPPEPNPAALRKFGATVRGHHAAVGFALDPDADRLVTGSPTAGAIHEEFTLPLALLGMPTRKGRLSGKIVVNLSTATLIDSVAGELGASVVRSAVGEANVVAEMQKVRAIFGGEGNGGVIHPKVPSFGRDSLVGAGLILSAMANSGASSLDDLMKRMPPLYMEKTKIELGRLKPAESLAKLEKNLAKQARLDKRDGLHARFEDGSWLHLRASNTEPILRLIAQASDRPELRRLIEDAKKSLGPGA